MQGAAGEGGAFGGEKEKRSETRLQGREGGQGWGSDLPSESASFAKKPKRSKLAGRRKGKRRAIR